MQNAQTALLRKYERYDAAVRSLLENLAQMPDDRLNRKPATGGWSPMQVLHHLILTEEMSLAYVRKKLSFNPDLNKVGLKNRWRTLVLHTFLRLPFKFKAPTVVGDTHLPEYATLEETRDRWEKIRADWKAYLPAIPDELLDKEVYNHPMVGRLSWAQTMGFLHGHFLRHRKQAQRGLV